MKIISWDYRVINWIFKEANLSANQWNKMEEIIIRKMGAIGRMTLNRPQALNSLTANMVKKIDLALDEWESDKEVTAVVIDAAGEKAFCAGGAITDIYNEAQ